MSTRHWYVFFSRNCPKAWTSPCQVLCAGPTLYHLFIYQLLVPLSYSFSRCSTTRIPFCAHYPAYCHETVAHVNPCTISFPPLLLSRIAPTTTAMSTHTANIECAYLYQAGMIVSQHGACLSWPCDSEAQTLRSAKQVFRGGCRLSIGPLGRILHPNEHIRPAWTMMQFQCCLSLVAVADWHLFRAAAVASLFQ